MDCVSYDKMRDMAHDKSSNPELPTSNLKRIMAWVIVVILTGFGLLLMITLYRMTNGEGDFWLSLIRDQFPVMVGLPMAGLGALFVTLVLRLYSGPIEFSLAGVHFKGASAPIVFWVLCFLVITVAIKLLWITP